MVRDYVADLKSRVAPDINNNYCCYRQCHCHCHYHCLLIRPYYPSQLFSFAVLVLPSPWFLAMVRSDVCSMLSGLGTPVCAICSGFVPSDAVVNNIPAMAAIPHTRVCQCDLMNMPDVTDDIPLSAIHTRSAMKRRQDLSPSGRKISDGAGDSDDPDMPSLLPPSPRRPERSPVLSPTPTPRDTSAPTGWTSPWRAVPCDLHRVHLSVKNALRASGLTGGQSIDAICGGMSGVAREEQRYLSWLTAEIAPPMSTASHSPVSPASPVPLGRTLSPHPVSVAKRQRTSRTSKYGPLPRDVECVFKCNVCVHVVNGVDYPWEEQIVVTLNDRARTPSQYVRKYALPCRNSRIRQLTPVADTFKLL